MRINKPIIWVIAITIFGTFIQLTQALTTGGSFDTGAVISVWFFAFGLVPAGIFWLITGRKGKAGNVKKKLLDKRVLGGIAATFIISFIIINGLTYMTSGFFFWDVMATHSLPMNMVQEKAGTFTRNYPEVIKGNWEPNALHMERMMVLDLERIKGLGINTVSIAAEYEFAGDGTYFIKDEEKIMSNIVRAKENGFAVWVGVSFVGGGSGHGLKEKGITLERYLDVSKEVALKWAEIAENYSAELFCPQTEMDYMLRTYYIEGDEAAREAEVVQRVTDWHNRILPEIKKVYTGKTVMKNAAMSKEWRNITLAGYDYVGSGLVHELMDPDTFRENVRERYSVLAEAAENSNADWGIFEAWFPFGGPFFPYTTTKTGQPLEPLQDDYYRISFEEFQNFGGSIKPTVFIFHSWTMLSSPVKGRPAEDVIKEYFGKM